MEIKTKVGFRFNDPKLIKSDQFQGNYIFSVNQCNLF